jgi:hypothetical protein
MKKYSILLVVILLVFAAPVFPQQHYVAGANAGIMVPFGSLSNRFKPAAVYNVFWGQETTANWTWTGNFEYFKFTKQNDSKLYVTRKLNDINYSYPMPGNMMTLEVAGLSVNAKYKVFENSFLRANINFGFGIYNWTYKRNAYKDSLYTPDSLHQLVTTVNLADNKQQDWSGGFNIGIGADVKIIEPVFFNVSCNYKAVIGELWPALDIDLENVSVFQMLEVKAGITVKF